MKRLLGSMTVAGLALVLAACGSSGGSSSSGAQPGTSSSTVSVASVGGVANVLVDAAGKPLYSPDQEAGGMIRCTGACTSFWMPLAPGASTPTANGLTFAVIARPDGSQQVTADGKPLYTFAEDAAGQLKGNGFSDDFNGQQFTWHVVVAGGGAAPTAPASNSGGRGYGY
jgi:predicted lipoprotein with Yx(FWY)xxD motif